MKTNYFQRLHGLKKEIMDAIEQVYPNGKKGLETDFKISFKETYLWGYSDKWYNRVQYLTYTEMIGIMVYGETLKNGEWVKRYWEMEELCLEDLVNIHSSLTA